jgi:hypothetical protein
LFAHAFTLPAKTYLQTYPRIGALQHIAALMQHNVSIRNISTRTNDSGAGRFNPKARDIDEQQRLLPLWPREMADRSLKGREKLIAALDRALRRERRHGRAGHPAYDIERHASLSRMLKEERAALAALRSRAPIAAPAAARMKFPQAIK